MDHRHDAIKDRARRRERRRLRRSGVTPHDFKRCLDAGMSNGQVLDLIRKSAIPVGVLGVEYGWLFETGEANACSRCSANSAENAVALGCTILMSAPGQVKGPSSGGDRIPKRAGDIAGEYGLKLAIEFNSQHDVLNSLAVLSELVEGADKPNCRLPDRCLSLSSQRRRRGKFQRTCRARKSIAFNIATSRPIR